VPKGHYTVISDVLTSNGTPVPPGGKPEPSSSTLLAQPDLDVNQPRTVTLDARLGQPISVTVPRPSASQIYAEVAAFTPTAGFAVQAGSFASLYAAQIGPDQPDDSFNSIVAGQWAQANPDASTDDSPYLYTLLYPVRGHMISGYQRNVVDHDLARVRADYASAQRDTLGMKRVSTGVADLDEGNFGPALSFHLPFTRTEYYNTDPGVESAGDFWERSDDDVVTHTEATSYTQYRADRTYHEEWNSGVFAPSLAAPYSFDGWQGVTRAADSIGIDVPLYTDGAGHPGESQTSNTSATLFRDGVKIGGTDGTRFGSIDVAPSDASYRLELHAERGAPFTLSTKTTIVWTFRSGHVDGTTPIALPLWSIRFTPELDRYNTAPGNGGYPVPVFVTPQPGAHTGTLVGLTVEASFDDGATWTPSQLHDNIAVVRHPGGAGFVSLRAKASDGAGNTVEQTIIRAYRYGDNK